MMNTLYYKNEMYINSMAKSFDLLANIFYNKMDKDLISSIQSIDAEFFLTDDLQLNEKVKCEITKIKKLTTYKTMIEINKDYNALFINPKGKFAYPWGSVYLNNENRLFGKSTIAFSHFCKNNNITLNLSKNIPYDHFGIMLAVLVHCLESKNDINTTKELLEQHMLTWSDRFLSLVMEHSSSGVYQTAAELCLLLLKNLKQQYNINDNTPIQLYK